MAKQLVKLGEQTILERSVRLFIDHPAVNEVIVALPPEIVEDPPGYLDTTVKAIRLVAGGARRQDSVANAFACVSERCELVVVHDAARPFASPALITRTIAAAAASGAAIAAVPARDTVKRAVASGGADVVLVAETLPRESIFLAQTPQAFRRDVLRDALAVSGDEPAATDEAFLAERAGHEVRLVTGELSNIKVTTPEDLPFAETLAGARDIDRERRAGTGYDLHRLVEARPLILGGVVVPSERGALGHSDADVVCHAVTDAMLGAANLGDIGRHFPDTDERWKDASSIDLLARASAMVRHAGFTVVNVDVTVILERPKIRDYIEAMRVAVGKAVGIETSQVSIKGKTNEGVDAIGRGEAIAAHAIALLSATGRR